MNGTADNIILKWLTRAIIRTFPAEHLHSCPYFGYYALSNVTIDVPQVGFQFRTGNYRTTLVFFDSRDELIFKSITRAEFMDIRLKKNKN